MLRPALVYFLLVFAAGFAFGTARVTLLAPRLGDSTAELIETPFMLAVVFFAARFVLTRFGAGLSAASAAGVGVLALLMLLGLEFTVVLGLRGLSLQAYFATRDTPAGVVYAISLLVFSAMPALLRAHARR